MKKPILLALASLALACSAPADDALDVADEPIGDDVATSEDPMGSPDPCLDDDDCAPPDDPEVLTAKAGARFVVRMYTALRQNPVKGGDLVLGIAPSGGVPRDGDHTKPSERGYIPQAQIVVAVGGEPKNGFVRVRYDQREGWIQGRKLSWLPPGANPIAYALAPDHRDVFFKHQMQRHRWNQDGPAGSSSNCGPTSLAMATRILGEEPPGLSIEQSIHRVRRTYDPGLHEHVGSLRSDLVLAAKDLGLGFEELDRHLEPDAALKRLDHQLRQDRLVVLAGMPGSASADPTAYERAVSEEYDAAAKKGIYLHNRVYREFVKHSILVLGKDGNGNYVVGDPMSEVGFVTIGERAMKDFMTRWGGGTGVAVWKKK